MSSIRPEDFDPETWDDQDGEPTFERLRKQTGKPQTAKGDRRQQAKEWGRAISKVHKERAKINKKP